jgi:arsenate reductase (thioredoxin)
METGKDRRRILFLCTGNSARSIFAEYLMNKIGAGRFEAYSAGSEPTGQVNPLTLRVLKESYQIDPSGARSKSWDEFKKQRLDFVITVCEKAKETCPIFPGQPIIAHWNIADPAVTTGTDDAKLFQFRKTAMEIRRRIDLLCSFPIEKIGHLLTQSAHQEPEAEKAN